jgi:competence protein ComEC
MLEVTAIDVGQGDSTLIVTPQGKTALLDAGGPIGGQHSLFDFGEQVVAPYLWSRGISQLDAVIISHGHSDHIGGMPSILNSFRPKEMWIGVTPENKDFQDLLSLAYSRGIRIREYFEGDQFDFGGARIRVFAPMRDQYVRAAKNNDSMALTFTYGASSVLLEGDAEKLVEHRVATENPGRVSLLKIAHNGSSTSTTPELLGVLQPSFAVISVGARNPFGHPRMETLEKLSSAHTKTYRTDLDGAVSFYLSSNGRIDVTTPR